jgi:hypothetical protein
LTFFCDFKEEAPDGALRNGQTAKMGLKIIKNRRPELSKEFFAYIRVF